MIRNALRAAASSVAASVDRAAAIALLRRSNRSRARSSAESLGPAERLDRLAQIRALYDRPEYFADPDLFFPRVAAAAPSGKHVRRYGAHGEVVDVRWPSDYRAFTREIAARFESTGAHNDTVVARTFIHTDRPRPAVILIHGYAGGHFALEERTWPIEWMFRRGLDVAIAVLPFHGARLPLGSRPVFPASDPRVTIEAFRQSVHDIRALGEHLAARGSPSVGVMGMSLGGYTTALLATVDARWSFAVPIIPLASIADVARDGGRFTGTDLDAARQHEALERAQSVVSPLARTPRIASDRVMVVGAKSDRITPSAVHAERLARHFDAPLELIHGGHLLQFGRGDAFRSIARMWARLGLLDPRATE